MICHYDTKVSQTLHDSKTFFQNYFIHTKISIFAVHIYNIDMKRSVSLSSYSIIISCIGLLILAGLCVYEYLHGFQWQTYILGAVILLLFTSALIYMPVSISADDRTLSVNRPLCHKSLPLAEIKSIKLCQPTMGARRICGSGGWFGYWGWFSERDLGKYFAYYGKASDCFLVTMKNGRKYMLGCKAPETIVDFVNQRIN